MIDKLKYSLISGLLFWLSWPTVPLPFLLFFAFIPLFLLEEKTPDRVHFFFLVLLTKFIWNISTTWWVSNATLAGGIAAVVANSLLMTIPWIIYHYVKSIIGIRIALLTFIASWLSFETIHLNWSLTWPWLNVGNAFASYHQWIQWYEFTGTLGGTLWVLLFNAYLFLIIQRKSLGRKKLIWLVSTFLIPIIISYSLYFSKEDTTSENIEIAVLQPNVDPYKQKFDMGDGYIPTDQQVANLIALSKKGITKNTDYLLWPETAVLGSHQESKIHERKEIQMIQVFLKEYPDLKLISGLESWDYSQDQENPPSTALFNQNLGYYEYYNSIMLLKSGEEPQFYHKSKLVPGVESLPFPSLVTKFNLLGIDNLASLTPQKKRKVFSNKQDTIAPAICYESIFGEFISEFVQNGAKYLFIITNDGWWGDTEGYRQHFIYAKLRAIENRIPVVRCANTGISGYFNTKGDIQEKTEWWKPELLTIKLPKNNRTKLTFYAKNGDYLGRMAYFLVIFTLLSTIVKKKTKF